MARSVPESLTLGLAGLLDLFRVDRLFGERVRTLMAVAPPLTAQDWRRLAGSEDDGSLAYEGPQVRRAYLAALLWQGLGWAWFVVAVLVLTAFLLAGNVPLKPGWGTVAFSVIVLAAGMMLGNWVVCLGIGRGRIFLGRPGGANLVWVVVALVFWLALSSVSLSPG